MKKLEEEGEGKKIQRTKSKRVPEGGTKGGRGMDLFGGNAKAEMENKRGEGNL